MHASILLRVPPSRLYPPFPPVLSATRESPGFINVRHYRFSRGIAFLFLSLPSRYPLARSIIAARRYRSATRRWLFSPLLHPSSCFPPPRYAALSSPAWTVRPPLALFVAPRVPLQPFSFNPRRRPHGIPRDFELCYSFSLPHPFARRRVDIASSYRSVR